MTKNASMIHRAGVAKSFEYIGARAADVATSTDAQSIYYVEQVSRSIGTNKESTMTLTLSCGRMMGKPSAIDFMLLLYKTYFDPALGFCSDLQEISRLKNKYSGSTHAYKIKPADTKVSIMLSQYDNLDFSVPHNVVVAEEPDEDVKDPYLVDSLIEDNSPYQTKTEVYQMAQARGWKKLTSVVTGKVYEITNPDTPHRGKVEYGYQYFVFDGSKNKWIFLRNSYGGNGEYGSASDELGINAMSISPESENIPYDVNDNNQVQTLHAQAMAVGDNSQFISIADTQTFQQNVVEDQPKQDQLTREQMLIEEFTVASIALNPEIFGNCLNINNIQYDKIISDNIGNEIIIPDVLQTGGKFDEQEEKKKEKQSSEKEEIPLTDEEKQEYGEDAQKTQWTQDGQNITRIEGEDKIGEFHSTENFTSSPTESDESFVKYKDKEGNSFEQRGKKTADENGNKYIVKTVNETDRFGGVSKEDGETKVTMAQVGSDGKQNVLFTDRKMSSDGKTLNAQQISSYMNSFHENPDSETVQRYLDKRTAFENTNIPPSMINGTNSSNLSKQEQARRMYEPLFKDGVVDNDMINDLSWMNKEQRETYDRMSPAQRELMLRRSYNIYNRKGGVNG